MNEELVETFIDRINDKLFKVILQEKNAAIEYLEVFLTEIAESLDLEGMTLQDANLLDEHLGEYFCDAIYETHLKQEAGEESPRKIRVILLFEHKTSIDSYFDLFLQLLGYIVLLWKKDRANKLPPTIVIPLVINQGVKLLKTKTLHDSLKNPPSLKSMPEILLKFIPQMEFHLLNIHPLSNETILNLREDGLLRSLLLSTIAVEDKNRIHGILIEIFKFMAHSPTSPDGFIHATNPCRFYFITFQQRYHNITSRYSNITIQRIHQFRHSDKHHVQNLLIRKIFYDVSSRWYIRFRK